MAVQTVSAEAVERAMRGDRPAVLVDVRAPSEYAGRHAAGARSIPSDRLRPEAVTDLRGSPADAVYVICQSGGRSAQACARLSDAGIAPVYSVDGGTVAWVAAGLPTEGTGRPPPNIDRQVRGIAGFAVLVGSLLAVFVNPAFVWLPAGVGAGLFIAGLTNTCTLGTALRRMPWNRVG